MFSVEGKCLARAQPARDKRWQSAATIGRMRPFYETSAPSPPLPPSTRSTDKLTVGIYEAGGPTLPSPSRGRSTMGTKDNRSVIKDNQK